MSARLDPPYKKPAKNRAERTGKVKDAGLKSRSSLQKKMRVGQRKPAGTAPFKSKNTRIYINDHVRKKPEKNGVRRGGLIRG